MRPVSVIASLLRPHLSVIPPAPWLESQVLDMVRRHPRSQRRTFGVGSHVVSRPTLRIAAPLVALLVIDALIATLLISARVHTQTVPVHEGNPVCRQRTRA